MAAPRAHSTTSTATKKDSSRGAHSCRGSTAHKKGVRRPKSHSGKHKAGSRKGDWQKVAVKLLAKMPATDCQGCLAAQDTVRRLQLMCSELTAAAAKATERARAAEGAALMAAKGPAATSPVYLRPIPGSWRTGAV